MDMCILDITCEASAPTTFNPIISNILVSNGNIELPYNRLSKSNQSCPICKTYFFKKTKMSMEMNEETRAECLIHHHFHT